jgi:hypothetical protein
MTFISKPMIAASAVIAMALVAGFDMAGPSVAKSPDATSAMKISERFPAAGETMAEVDGSGLNVRRGSAGARHQRPVAATGCTHEHWPYIADECLVSEDAAPRKPARTIAIEKRITTASKAAPVNTTPARPVSSQLAAVATTVASR